ncbi:hypothetical protein R1flu_019512 [Riccia fluitans]|uniref:Uncharacterized protein n=1 Tax=Riccia fluitans TaxID=41844 RepID=A0ABD1ZMC1_9MARC
MWASSLQSAGVVFLGCDRAEWEGKAERTPSLYDRAGQGSAHWDGRGSRAAWGGVDETAWASCYRGAIGKGAVGRGWKRSGVGAVFLRRDGAGRTPCCWGKAGQASERVHAPYFWSAGVVSLEYEHHVVKVRSDRARRMGIEGAVVIHLRSTRAEWGTGGEAAQVPCLLGMGAVISGRDQAEGEVVIR